MKRTIVITVAAITLLFIVVKVIKGPVPTDMVWTGNKVTASFPPEAINEPVGNAPSRVEIYIDASGSMKPYFRAEGNVMVNTISKIVNLHGTSQKIYFLGNETPYSGLVSNIIRDVARQPNQVATTFHEFFKDVADSIDTTDKLVYMVTDGIISIGRGNTSDALVELSGKIENSLKGHENLAGVIMRFEGQYKGDYWNSQNMKITPQECPMLAEEIQRPFYVIALGSKEAIRWLKQQPIEKLNSPKAQLFMGIHDLSGHTKAKLDMDSARIEDMHKSVTLSLDLPMCLAEIDASKVQAFNDGKPQQASVQNEGGKIVVTIDSLTNLKLKRENDGRIRVTLLANNEIPSSWTLEWNTDDDSDGPDSITTYGLKYLVSGMFDGLEGEQLLLKAEYVYILQ